jgi:demethylmenaquinone methyltransferase / 2-methoxy-6-polyprenyl-1,4-benzoquinol methylase
MSKQDEQKIDFGYQQVPINEKVDRVGNVFHSVASKYDIMNDLMSFGAHRLWKRQTIHLANIRPGMNVLDLASGTADLAKQIAPKIGKAGKMIVSDINESMLSIGRTRLIDANIIENVAYVIADAEALCFPSCYFDRITIAFGLRNVTRKDAALRSIFRCLKPGGMLLILEFSKPTIDWLNPIYDAYSFQVLPRLGKWIANDEESYQYLAESIRMHPDQATLREMVLEAGFDTCDIHNFAGGIVALHKAYKA